MIKNYQYDANEVILEPNIFDGNYMYSSFKASTKS